MTSTLSASDALALHRETIRETLPNGLTLLVRRDRSAPVVAIVTHVKAGYFDETDDVVGIAHVLEHMYFKGTPTRGVGEIARETKANGGYLNAHTIYDHTSYYTVLPSAAFAQGLEIQFDAYARSTIDREELARELEVIIQEVKRKRDTPQAVAIESLYALLHDRHRIRRWRMGEEGALRAMTRDQLERFYRHWYRPSNTILAVVGDVDPATVREEVVRRYGMLSDAPVNREPGPVEVAPSGFRYRDWSGDVAQQQLVFGWRAPALTHADAAPLDLAGIALGTGRASRLYRAVRERQLASSVSSWSYNAGDIGLFVVHAEAPPEHAPAAASALWRETQSARRHGFRRSEIERAQRIIEARWLRRLETMDGQATYLASWEAEGGLESAARYYDRLLSLDARETRAAMERHLDPSQVAVISYRPDGAAPLGADVDAVRELLLEVEGEGSSVLPPPDSPTPRESTAVDGATAARHAAALSVGAYAAAGAHVVTDGVHVSHTRRGVPVLVMPRAGAPLVNLGVFQRGGACLEPEGREGLARLTAQAMLKGTARRSGARVAEAAEELGASIAVSAGLESLGWSMSVPVRHLETAAELLADVTGRPSFPADGVETERALAIAEVSRLRDDMYRWPLRLATATAYAGHLYARGVIGTELTLPSLDAGTAREYHERHVARGANVIAIVGDVSPDEAFVMVEREFGALEWQDDPHAPEVLWPSEARVAEDAREKQQTALALLFPGPGRRDPDRFAARVLSAVASGLGGRFFEQLRDRQSLAYTVSAFPVERRGGGAFAAYIATSPAREVEARAGLLAEFERLRNAPPDEEELDRARRYLIGTHAISRQSGASVLGDIVDAWLFGEGLHEPSEFDARVAAVTADDVLTLARRHFDPARVVEGIVRGQ